MTLLTQVPFIAAGAFVAYAAYTIAAFFVQPLFSPLRHLRGPKETNGFLLGNVPDIDSARALEWVDEYGKVFRCKGFLSVRIR